MLKWITPSLAVGYDWVEDDTFAFPDIDEATLRIQLGGRAVVDSEATAAAVMHNLGMDDNAIEDRLHFASTGCVLHP